jgi:ribose-phosphate pyrophosphokinase
MKLISGNANQALAQALANELDDPLCDTVVERFADSEIRVTVNGNVRNEDVFVIQPTSAPANDHLMELLIVADALKRSSARSITAVIPYFGYARQDRKMAGRTPISAKLVANLITAAGYDRVLTVDLHSGQIGGFFDLPVNNLDGSVVFAHDIVERYERPLIVSPDVGGVVRARSLANRIGADLAIVDKRRPEAGVSEVMNIIGDVKGRQCIMFDDMADSGGTLVNAAEAMLKQGAESVSAYVTHGVLSPGAHERIMKSKLKELVISDSISYAGPVTDKIRTVSIAPLLAEAVRRIGNGESVSKLFR